MTLVGHLRELRNRILLILFIILLAFTVSYNYIEVIMAKLIDLAPGYEFIYIAPSELFMQQMKVSLIAGVIVASPFILYELWAFIHPGLKQREKNIILFSLIFGFFSFLIGCLFAYFLVIPNMLVFFRTVTDQHIVQASVTIEKFIGFVLSILVTFGVVFEIPVLISLLTQLGVLKPEWLVKGRRMIIVGIFILSAVITPTTDIMNMLVMAVPMLFLFEVSILLSRLIYKRKKQRKVKAVS